ncbi:unnamed protein product [Larinioides sclopetarius]|uniref:Uncharacterized protein n=1 Tax=Larinioides sclopetarius TaxID=280406 RepID=A0AAV2ALM1_9ARAC
MVDHNENPDAENPQSRPKACIRSHSICPDILPFDQEPDIIQRKPWIRKTGVFLLASVFLVVAILFTIWWLVNKNYFKSRTAVEALNSTILKKHGEGGIH